MVRTLYRQCLTCQGQNPGKTVFVPRGLKPPPSEPFEHLQLESLNCHSVGLSTFSLSLVWFPEGLKPFRDDALTVARKLLADVSLYHSGWTFHSFR